MNPYIEKLNDYISQHPVNASYENAQSVLDLLCYIYISETPVYTSVTRYQFQALNEVLEHLTREENDRLFHLVMDLCEEHARRAFLEGFQVGYRLSSELES